MCYDTDSQFGKKDQSIQNRNKSRLQWTKILRSIWILFKPENIFTLVVKRWQRRGSWEIAIIINSSSQRWKLNTPKYSRINSLIYTQRACGYCGHQTKTGWQTKVIMTQLQNIRIKANHIHNSKLLTKNYDESTQLQIYKIILILPIVVLNGDQQFM